MYQLAKLQEATYEALQAGFSSAVLQQLLASDIVDLLTTRQVSTIIISLTAIVSSARLTPASICCNRESNSEQACLPQCIHLPLRLHPESW